MDKRGARPASIPKPMAPTRDVQEYLLDLEGELLRKGAVNREVVFLVENIDGRRDNRTIRGFVDVMKSASLRNYHPLGGPATTTIGRDYADLSHIAAGIWVPSEAMSFGDSHEARVVAREVIEGRWKSMFSSYSPDKRPQQRREMATTFITGNPRVGQAFLDSLELALGMSNTVIAHWNEAATRTYVVFAVPAAPPELEAASLRFNPASFEVLNREKDFIEMTS